MGGWWVSFYIMHCAAYGKFIETFFHLLQMKVSNMLRWDDRISELRTISFQTLSHPWRHNNLHFLDSTVLRTLQISRCQHAREAQKHFHAIGALREWHNESIFSSLCSVPYGT